MTTKMPRERRAQDDRVPGVVDVTIGDLWKDFVVKVWDG